MGYVAIPTKNPGDVLTSALWNTYLQGNADSGFLRMLADTTLGGAAASIDFTSIPGTFAHLLLIAYLRDDNAGAQSAASLRANNDTGGNYDRETLVVQGATASAGEAFASTSFLAGSIPGAAAAANLFAEIAIEIPHYANALNNKTFHSRGSHKQGTASGNLISNMSAGFWRSSAAINRLTLIPSGSNFVAGCRVTLYGLPA